jgi:Na+/melibiose symporter-like transporter
MLGALLGAAGTQARILAFERNRLVTPVREFSIVGSLVATWRALADLANFRALFLGLVFAGVMGSYFRALNLSLGTYFWGLSTGQTGDWLQSIQIATFIAALASRAIVSRIEPRNLYIAGVATMLGAYVLPPLARLLGLLPPNGSAALVEILYGANMAVGAGTGLIMSCSLVLFAESADEYALVKRESRTGMLLAFLPLGNKMASSLGKFAAGVVMQWTALRPGPKAAPAGAAALQHLGVATVALTSVAGLLALMFFLQYRLPRSRYAEILRGLEAERAAVPELR